MRRFRVLAVEDWVAGSDVVAETLLMIYGELPSRRSE